MIIHLNGWPGVGKKTIGAVLAQRLGARFIHNHLLHDVAIACAGLESPARWTLYEQVRAAAYFTLRARPADECFVMTNALCKDTQRELEAWRHVVELAMSRGVPLIPVVLEAELDENVRRVQSPERDGRKMTDPEKLRRWFASEKLQYPNVPELLALNVTDLTPWEAAVRIENHVRSLGSSGEGLKPATPLHLQIR